MAVFVLAAALMVEGANRVRVAETIPAYTDPAEAARPRSIWPDDTEDTAKRKAWFEKMEAVRTDKWKVYDRGRTLIVLSMSVTGVVLGLRFWREDAFKNLATPSRRGLILLGGATYLSFVPATWLALRDEAVREYLPWWGDTISIPGFTVAFFALLTLPVLLLVLWLCVRRARLPSRLWALDAARPVTSTVASLIFGGVALALAISLIGEVRYGAPYYLFSLFCLIYVVLSLRAALLAPRAAPSHPDNSNSSATVTND
jgi:hypothetical protein